MTDKTTIKIMTVLLLITLALGKMSGCIEKEKGYKQGQIDAIQGKVKYALEKQDNGEMVWREKK